MLSRSSQTSRTSTLLSPESVHPLQDYLPNLQAPSSATFPKIDNDQTEGGDGEESASQTDSDTLNEANRSELAHLMPRNDFGEMFNRFFVAGHKQLRILQSQIQKHNNSFRSLADLNTHNIQSLRQHYYQLQVVLFRSPKGRNHDTAI